MSKLKIFFIKIGLIPAPKGFKYNPIDKDGDGLIQEGTPFERFESHVKVIPAKKKAAKKPAKKAPAKKKAVKKKAK